jgi:hypothetical protein
VTAAPCPHTSGVTIWPARLAGDKAHLGDVYYEGVATRADPLIDQRKRETAREERP